MPDARLSDEARVLERVYRSFNARDIDATLAAMKDDVEWPNGMEGGYVYGRSAVRDYWQRQWITFDPHVEPVGYTWDDRGWLVIDVHQVVRDRAGVVLVDQMIRHAYHFQDDLIARMEILPALP